MPVAGDLRAECGNRMPVGGNTVIRGVPTYDGAEPSPLLRDGLVAAAQYLGLDLMQRGRHSLPLRLPPQEKPSRPRAPTEMGEPEEVKALRLATKTPVPTVGEGEPPKRNESCLGRVQLQSERRESLAQFLLKPLGIVAVLKPDEEVVGVPHDDYITVCRVHAVVTSASMPLARDRLVPVASRAGR